jgi:hypothetical protein
MLAVTAALVAVPVMAYAPESLRLGATGDPCASLRAEMDDAEESRFACARDEDETCAAWIAAPAPGVRDLVLTAVHLGPRGTRAAHTFRLTGAREWFPTIAPLTVAPSATGATVDVVRVGFRSYPLAHEVLVRE